jgi:nickel/cobalt exporter
MNSLLPFATALLLGAAHALEADHMAAVTAFAVRRPTPRSAALFGVRWAFGHGLVIVLVGTAIFALGIRLAPDDTAWVDRFVGVVLVAFGVWTASRARTLHAHEHRHDDGTLHAHLHAHGAKHSTHDHRHGATLMGVLHGLAGTVPVLALLPITRLDSPAMAFGYLLMFALGTAVSMALYAMFAGAIAGRAAVRSELIGRALVFGTGIATAAIGVAWVLR